MDTLLLAKSLLCPLLSFLCSSYIDFLRLFCCLNKKSYTVVDDFNKSHSNNSMNPLVAALWLELHLTFINCNNHIFMMGKNFLLSIELRHNQRTAFASEKHPVS